MKTLIIAIDPGNITGITHGFSDENLEIASKWDFTPKKAQKNKAKEFEHLRYGKLLATLQSIVKTYQGNFKVVVACEAATAFTRGKNAIEVSNQYRGVVKAFAAYKGYAFYYIQPADLKRFALGKGVGDKAEIVSAAKSKYGYDGFDDNEADSLFLYHWVKSIL